MDSNTEIVSVCIIIAVVIAGLSAAISYWFASGRSGRSMRGNATLSAGIASGLIASFLVFILLIENGIDEELGVVLLAMAFGEFAYAALVGFPVAMIVQRKTHLTKDGGRIE